MNLNQQTDDDTGSGDDLLPGEAIDWLICLNETEHEPGDPYADVATRNQAFFAWLKRSERHLSVFLETLDLECRIRSLNRNAIDDVLRSTEMPVVTSIAESSTEERSDEVQVLSATRPQRRFWMMKVMGAVIAVALLAVAINFFMGSPDATATTRTFLTDIGEVRTETLDDGTVMTLNTDSRVEVTISDNTRDIHLTQGESYFDVSYDAERPFNVMVDNTRVSALATSFSVRKAPEGVDVTVKSGRVLANPKVEQSGAVARALETLKLSRSDRPDHGMLLSEGEKATMSSGQVLPVPGVNVADELAWKQGMLVFHNKRLSYVAEQFNRYNPQKLRIEGPQVGEILVTGAYGVHRYEDVVSFARTRPNLLVEQVGNDYVIKSKEQN